MRVTIIAAAFPPETIVAGRMAFDLAVELNALGHETRVVCPYPSRLPGKSYQESRVGGAVTIGEEKGIAVVRVPSFTSPRSRMWPRLRESWSFGRWASRFLFEPRGPADVVYEVAWPMLAQAWISCCCARHKIPRVTHIMDLYPEAALSRVPKWLAPLVARPLVQLDRANAWQATKVLVVSQGLRQIYRKTRGLPEGKLSVIETWQDERPFLNLPSREEACRRYAVPSERFTWLYLGNIGAVAGVEHLINSFEKAALGDAQLVIAGEGSHKQRCVQLARRVNARIQFVSDPDPVNVPRLQSLADVCLLPVTKGRAFSSVPSKLCAYMLSGKPVLASVDLGSDSAAVITRAQCGWVVAPEAIDALSQMMRQVAMLPHAELAAKGAQGRAFALKYFSRQQRVQELAAIILEAAGPRKAPVGATGL